MLSGSRPARASSPHRPRRHGQDTARDRGRVDARARVQGGRLLGWPGPSAIRRLSRRHRPDARRQGRPRRAHRRAGDVVLLDNLEQVIEAAPGSRPRQACPNLTLLSRAASACASGEVEYPVPPLAEPEAVTFSAALAPGTGRGMASSAAARQPAAGRRARGCPHDGTLSGPDPRSALRAPRPPRRAAATPIPPADAARDDRVELRASVRGRAAALRPPLGVRRRLHVPRPRRRSRTPTSTPCSRSSRRASFVSRTSATGCSRRSAGMPRRGSPSRATKGQLRRRHARFFLELAQSLGMTYESIEVHGRQRHDVAIAEQEELSSRRSIGHWRTMSSSRRESRSRSKASGWRSARSRGVRRFERLLERSEGRCRTRSARVAGAASQARRRSSGGRAEDVIDQNEKSLDLYRRAGDDRGIAIVLNRLGDNFWFLGDAERGRSLIEESLARYRAFGSAWARQRRSAASDASNTARGTSNGASSCSSRAPSSARDGRSSLFGKPHVLDRLASYVLELGRLDEALRHSCVVLMLSRHHRTNGSARSSRSHASPA